MSKSKSALLLECDTFTTSYLETALWSSCDNNDVSLDDNYYIDQIEMKTLRRMISDCKEFQESCNEALEKAGDEGQNGFVFALTRCGHGVGFWDRGYSDEVEKVLVDCCEGYGNVDLYVHRGLIYGS